jgi:hypothetical protein
MVGNFIHISGKPDWRERTLFPKNIIQFFMSEIF